MTITQSRLNEFTLDDITHFSRSVLMQDIFYKAIQLAKSNSNVILVGEIGSGKHRLAEIIHKNSHRNQGPFDTFSCLNINETIYKEAFWGQLKIEDNQLFLQYDLLEKTLNGTLYLDQFSELSPSYMLNILESYKKGCKHIFRNGCNKKKPRLILSFNQDLYHQLIQKSVWEKILTNLNPVMIMLPPLREHREDIPLIIDYFIKELRANHKKFKDLNISAPALLACFNYDWPGNFLQLKNAILQGAILSRGKIIKRGHLPLSLSLS